MAKILISSIGTGDRSKGYNKANYKIDDKIYENETFIAKALSTHLKIDKLFLVGTKDSIWENVYERFGAKDDEVLKILEFKDSNNFSNSDLDVINQKIDENLNSKGSKSFIIEYGLNENELWSNFEIFLNILNLIEDGDELYLDITHSFRSLSLMSFVMSEFGKLNKNFKINGVYYGMFEISRQNNGISPIIDLKIFFDFLEWSKAINNLKNYGNAQDILKLFENSNESKEIINSFSNFSNALSISDMGALQNSVKLLKGKIKVFEEHNNKIIKLISKDLLEFINRFSIESLAKFQFELAKWYVENKNYAMAYITLAEATVSIICETNNLNETSQDDRKKAQSILFEYNDWQKSSKQMNEIGDAYSKVNNIRNNIAHKLSSQSNKSKSTPKDSIENIERYIKKLSQLFSS